MEVECVKAKRKTLMEMGLYEPEDKRWSCGVGGEVICH